MTFDSLMLFIHILGALTLFVGFGLEWSNLNLLRTATTFEGIRAATKLTARGLPLNIFAALAILLPGLYLATRLRVWNQGWTEVAIASVFLMAALGGGLTGRRMRVIQQASVRGMGPAPRDLRGRLRDRLLVASFQARVTLVLGVVLLMVTKPELGTSLLVVGTAIAVGMGWAVAMGRSQVSPRSQEPGVGEAA